MGCIGCFSCFGRFLLVLLVGFAGQVFFVWLGLVRLGWVASGQGRVAPSGLGLVGFGCLSWAEAGRAKLVLVGLCWVGLDLTWRG